VSEPNAQIASSDATEAAEPPEEPPVTLSKSQGLCVGPKQEFSVEEPNANSSILVFISNIVAPASFNFLITVASYGGLKPSKILEQHSVFKPSVEILSLIEIGMPFNSLGESANVLVGEFKKIEPEGLTYALTLESISLILFFKEESSFLFI
jgi:hypothetical protein